MPRRWLIVGLATVALVLGVTGAMVLWPNPAPHIISVQTDPRYQDFRLLTRAWALPVARTFGPADFEYQQNGSFCGPASAANVLRSSGIAMDQQRLSEEAGVATYFGLIPFGLTLDTLASIIARRFPKDRVRVLRDLDLAAFRAQIARSNDPTRRIIINFTRQPLFGRGHGHHSPVLGYLESEDLVFVGDVNSEYRPWLVPTARLFEAMDTIDSASGRKRGLIVISLDR